MIGALGVTLARAATMPSLRQTHRVVLCLVLVTIGIGCTKYQSAPPTAAPSGHEKGPRTLAEAREYLVGKWTLVNMDVFPPNAPPIQNAATGSMVYDEFSNMTVTMMFNPEAAKLTEKIGIPTKDGVLTTTGRTLIDIGQRSLSYVLEGEPDYRPARHPLDTNLPRYWEANGNRLTLRTKDSAGKVLTVSIWQK
jgi:hypothetical protein